MSRVLRRSMLALFSFGLTADTISEFSGGTSFFLNEYYFGQMIITPTGGPWHNITFCFGCSGAGRDPGKLYLLSQEYLGLPSNLSWAPGLIATSTGTSQYAWMFASSVLLQPDTTYYFYEDGTWMGAVYWFGDPVGPFPAYMTQGWPNLNTPFHRIESVNYRLSGDPVPEPVVGTLLLLGLLTLLIAWRRRPNFESAIRRRSPASAP